jgi:hypothetical protein
VECSVHVVCLEFCGKPYAFVIDIIYLTKILVRQVFAHVYLNILQTSTIHSLTKWTL